jgi:hypothetical protein
LVNKFTPGATGSVAALELSNTVVELSPGSTVVELCKFVVELSPGSTMSAEEDEVASRLESKSEPWLERPTFGDTTSSPQDASNKISADKESRFNDFIVAFIGVPWFES